MSSIVPTSAQYMACQQALAVLDAHCAPLPASHTLRSRCQPQKVPWCSVSRQKEQLTRASRDDR
jgi:hypothetical protein